MTDNSLVFYSSANQPLRWGSRGVRRRSSVMERARRATYAAMEREDLPTQTISRRYRNGTRRRSRRLATTEESMRSVLTVIVLCVAVWLVMRVVFFVGITGSDDLRYIRYAALWDRAPINTWEARTLGNALTAISMSLFGRGEVAAALPSMVASLLTLACTLYWCFRRGCSRYAYWGGMLVAVLPLDVEMATTVSPHTVMVGFMSVGTLWMILESTSRRGQRLAAVALALGFVSHFAGVYYIAALSVAVLCVDHRKYGPTVLMTAAACAVGLLIEMGVLYAAFGEPFARLHACFAETHYVKPIMPHLADGSLNVEYLMWPIKSVFFSKAFGVSLAIVMFVGLLRIQHLDAPERILVLTIVLFWLWMSFGSEVPWRYVSFDRISRFLQPLTLALSALFAVLIATRRNWWVPTTVVSVVITICVANLMGSGPWGQNARISEELLEYVRSNPQTRFLADYRTANELYILNGVRSVKNVVVLDDGHRSRLLDKSSVWVDFAVADERVDEILVNKLNMGKSPEFVSFVERSGGAVTFQTLPQYRTVAMFIRPLMDHPWAVRKPPAIVRECRDNGTSRVVLTSHAE